MDASPKATDRRALAARCAALLAGGPFPSLSNPVDDAPAAAVESSDTPGETNAPGGNPRGGGDSAADCDLPASGYEPLREADRASTLQIPGRRVNVTASTPADPTGETKGASLGVDPPRFFARGSHPTLADLRDVLLHHPAWTGVLGFDTYRHTVAARTPTPWGAPGPWTDLDTTALQMWIADEFQAHSGPDMVDRVVTAVAHRTPFSSLVEEIQSYAWDEVPRLDTWLSTYLRAEPTPLVAAMGRAFLVAAVARALEPGCKSDHTMVWEGPERSFKSSAVEVLAGKDHYSDAPLDLRDQRAAAMQLHGVWFQELPEMSILQTAKTDEEVTDFLGKKADRYTPKYHNCPILRPRTNVFVGTTSDGQYLSKSTGNRKWWPVKVGRIDLEGLARDRRALWAEAVAAYRAQPVWWLDATMEQEAATEQDARYLQHPWETPISRHLHHHLGALTQRGYVTTAEILEHVLRRKVDQWSDREERVVAKILHRLGWKRGKRRRDPVSGARIYPYLCPVPLHVVRSESVSLDVGNSVSNTDISDDVSGTEIGQVFDLEGDSVSE